eukprot:scaffold270_cov121-Isochrysis_galbana.AAC.3
MRSCVAACTAAMSQRRARIGLDGSAMRVLACLLRQTHPFWGLVQGRLLAPAGRTAHSGTHAHMLYRQCEIESFWRRGCPARAARAARCSKMGNNGAQQRCPWALYTYRSHKPHAPKAMSLHYLVIPHCLHLGFQRACVRGAPCRVQAACRNGAPREVRCSRPRPAPQSRSG